MTRVKRWEREELLLVLDLYFEAGVLPAEDSRVIELSTALRRLPKRTDRNDSTYYPDPVALQLGMFQQIDHDAGAIRSTPGFSLHDQLREEYRNDRDRLRGEAAVLRASIPRAYWGGIVNPRIYDLESAADDLTVDNWTTKGRPVRADDRFLIWQSQDAQKRRGVVQPAEVLGTPRLTTDSGNPHWLEPERRDSIEERAEYRVVSCPNLPLWLTEDTRDLLGKLTVARGQGTIFYVEPTDWFAVMDRIGCWQEHGNVDMKRLVEDTPEAYDAQPQGQGAQADTATRKAVEDYAMRLAREHYSRRGWQVEDVSGFNSFDLLCVSSAGEELRVEVKGTSGDGSSVRITRNEYDLARSEDHRVALYVVSGIRLLHESGINRPTHQSTRILDPWTPTEDSVKVISYEYLLPLDDR